MWIRYAIAVAVIGPLMLGFGGHWLTTLLIAIVGFGFGHVAQSYVEAATPEERPRRTTHVGVITGVWLLGYVAMAGLWLVQREQAVNAMEGVELRVAPPVERTQTVPTLTVHEDGFELMGRRASEAEVRNWLAEVGEKDPGAVVNLRPSSDDVPHASLVAALDLVMAMDLHPAIIP